MILFANQSGKTEILISNAIIKTIIFRVCKGWIWYILTSDHWVSCKLNLMLSLSFTGCVKLDNQSHRKFGQSNSPGLCYTLCRGNEMIGVSIDKVCVYEIFYSQTKCDFTNDFKYMCIWTRMKTLTKFACWYFNFIELSSVEFYNGCIIIIIIIYYNYYYNYYNYFCKSSENHIIG